MLRTFIDTTVDRGLLVERTDMHFFQAIHEGVEGAEWENMYY